MDYLNREPSFIGDALAVWDKALYFLKDKRFHDIFYDSTTSELEKTRQWRVHVLVWAASQAMSIKGDFIELGTYRGFYSYSIYKYLDFEKSNKRIFLFDTFDGFDLDISSSKDFQGGSEWFDLANDEYSQRDIYNEVLEKFNKPNCNIVKGSVMKTLPENLPDFISFVSLDLNSPVAEKFALEQIWEKLSNGGIIVLDDYGWNNMSKQAEVHNDFFHSKKHMILELPTGQGLVIKH